MGTERYQDEIGNTHFKEYDDVAGDGSVRRPIAAKLPSHLTYTQVSGSPFTLVANWTKVATINKTINALLITDASQASYDIFWTSVVAGGSAPANDGTVLGLSLGASEDFQFGIPVGDIYLRSATGAKATVMTGV